MSERSVAVIGTVNRDRIVAEDGRSLTSLGGILYNAIPLAVLLEGSHRVRLHGRLGSRDREEALRLLAPFPAADGSSLIADANGTNESVLDYSRGGERVETVEMRVGPLTGEDLAGVEAADAVLVNMISGRDVEPGALSDLRARSGGLFLLDVQALARTLDSPRRSRAVPDWKDWCAPFDVVRGNEEEITWFPGGPCDLEESARRILGAGPGEVLVTRGKRGAVRFTRPGSMVQAEDVEGFPRESAGDPTGCGDSFLSGVCAARVLGADPGASVWLGTYVAAEVAGLSGLADLARLRGLPDRAAREPRLRGPSDPGAGDFQSASEH